MGLAIPNDGHITCIDNNQKTSQLAKNFFKRAKLEKIQIILGSGMDTIKKYKTERKFF